jgi:peptidoglycan/xylan/chitin deacetylase (PgdA/CDA1 family)
MAMRQRFLLGISLLFLAICLSTPSFSRVVTIIIYHDVPKPEEMNSYMDTAPDNFKDQMNFLKRNHYNVVPTMDIVKWLKKEKKLPPKTVAVNFDDNYLGTYTNAFPVLIQNKFPATTFVHTKYPGVMTLKDHADWEELQKSEDSGFIDVESHTVTHSMLSTLSYESAKFEIEQSKKDIETHLRNKVCRIIAYPCNSWDNQIIKLAKAAGYEAGVCGINENLYGNENLFLMKRQHVSQTDTLETFKKRLKYTGSDPDGPVIIDNLYKGFKAAGTWTSSNDSCQYYSTDYLTAEASPVSNATATFKPVIQKAGKYSVYAWFNNQGPRSAAVHYTIHHAQGDTAVTLSQQTVGAHWVSLGTFTLNKGKTSWVSVTNQGPQGTFIVADAMKFEPVL